MQMHNTDHNLMHRDKGLQGNVISNSAYKLIQEELCSSQHPS